MCVCVSRNQWEETNKNPHRIQFQNLLIFFPYFMGYVFWFFFHESPNGVEVVPSDLANSTSKSVKFMGHFTRWEFDAFISNKWALKIRAVPSKWLGKKVFWSNTHIRVHGKFEIETEKERERLRHVYRNGNRAMSKQYNVILFRIFFLSFLFLCTKQSNSFSCYYPISKSFICMDNLWLFIFDFINCFRLFLQFARSLIGGVRIA